MRLRLLLMACLSGLLFAGPAVADGCSTSSQDALNSAPQHSDLVEPEIKSTFVLKDLVIRKLDLVPKGPSEEIQQRVQEQRECGCTSRSRVSFGDNFLMRAEAQLEFEEPVRRLVAAAELSDDLNYALNVLDRAKSKMESGTLQHYFVDNHAVSLAIRFGAMDRAEALLGLLSIDDSSPHPAAQADRLFMAAYVATQKAGSAANWRSISKLLQRATIKDPRYFNAIVWRAITWLKEQSQINARFLGTAEICKAKANALSLILLDITQASPCPLMVGHLSHYLATQFSSRFDRWKIPSHHNGAHWRAYIEGLFARISHNDATYQNALKHLELLFENAQSGRTCVGAVHSALTKLGDGK